MFVKKKKVSGFTLIELLIAMALTVTLAVIGFINLTGYRQNQDLGNAAKEIVAILRDAQNRTSKLGCLFRQYYSRKQLLRFVLG